MACPRPIHLHQHRLFSDAEVADHVQNGISGHIDVLKSGIRRSFWFPRFAGIVVYSDCEFEPAPSMVVRRRPSLSAGVQCLDRPWSRGLVPVLSLASQHRTPGSGGVATDQAQRRAVEGGCLGRRGLATSIATRSAIQPPGDPWRVFAWSEPTRRNHRGVSHLRFRPPTVQLFKELTQ
jgi:hypothetical protein